MFFFLVTSSFMFFSFLSGFKTGELAAVSHSEKAIEEFFNPPRFNGLEEHSSALLIVLSLSFFGLPLFLVIAY